MEKGRLILSISGQARAGKDTFADMLKKAFAEKADIHFETIAYADTLKQRLMNDFDLSHEQLYGNEKELADFRYPKKGITTIGDSNYPADYWTPREIMQFMGTDCYRAVDDNFWVKSLFKKIDSTPDNFIITDCRFKTEIDPIIDRGGYHIRIERDNADSITNANHSSETELQDKYKVDITVNNNGGLVTLKATANETVAFVLYLENKKVI